MVKEMKKEMIVEKKYDRFAVWSFVLGLVVLIFLLLRLIIPKIQGYSMYWALNYVIGPAGLVALVFGIVALIKIKKNDTKGKALAIIGIVSYALDIIISISILILGLRSF